VSPQRPDLVLASDIPDIELCVLVGDGLDVKTDGRDGCHVLVELEFVEDGCGYCLSMQSGRGEALASNVLVLPAASSPSISRRISLDPKILFIILDIEAPMAAVFPVEVCYEPCSKVYDWECGDWVAGEIQRCEGACLEQARRRQLNVVEEATADGGLKNKRRRWVQDRVWMCGIVKSADR